MIHDTLDLVNPKPQFSLTGKFFEKRPISPEDGAEEFNYEYVNPYSKTFRLLFPGMQISARDTAIRTDDNQNYKDGESFVLLQDGKLFQIAQVEVDYESANKQAFRYLAVPMGTEFVLRLIEVENPWGIGK